MTYEFTIKIYRGEEIKFQKDFDTISDVQRWCNSFLFSPVQSIEGFTVNTKYVQYITYREVK